MREHQQLTAAFAQFNTVSGQLIEAYHLLEQQAVQLNQQLEAANQRLRVQGAENAALAERLGQLLAALPGGVVELDAGGVVRRENPAASTLFGRPLVGLHWGAVLADCEAGSLEHNYRLQLNGQPGARVMLQYQDLPELGGRIVLVHDVTRQFELTAELAHQQKLAAMGSMAASLAHQLRTPLSAAMLYTANLREGGLAPEARARFVDKSVDRLRALEGLIHNMLDFVRGQVTQRERLVAGQLTEDALQALPPSAQGVELRGVSELGETAQILGDRKAVGGALSNLLDNALQHSPPGGVVELSVHQAGDEVVWQVADQGPGLPDGVLEQVFEPFFTRRPGGTGLGLAIVKKVAEELGGRVSCRNRPQGGALFELALPLADEARPGAAS
ncbi:PAS domain-containing sensor histidine kinase [Crenobacter sp. SG2303]|uniref:histidine kinase n=1 Tax=Crenobacter oryzisoli TaxID=3056844 RepID=A0ABT7XNZ2_9NEIS|nr:PAS domain-containing sensor histidine kinase [Crenobacter sp. SG2303]MDN0075513.1 PAS domain-containing sensor histidine kinase [Crenobacter sp. SG2303]